MEPLERKGIESIEDSMDSNIEDEEEHEDSKKERKEREKILGANCWNQVNEQWRDTLHVNCYGPKSPTRNWYGPRCSFSPRTPEDRPKYSIEHQNQITVIFLCCNFELGSVLFSWNLLNWTELNWTELNGTELNWTETETSWNWNELKLKRTEEITFVPFINNNEYYIRSINKFVRRLFSGRWL